MTDFTRPRLGVSHSFLFESAICVRKKLLPKRSICGNLISMKSMISPRQTQETGANEVRNFRQGRHPEQN
ncbi:MAG TPA: hypothetical protein DDW68_05050 [Verrucomicrobiales bacterium]|nr:hypothetical protein [Verrucomicrobiales bacterium]